MKISKALGINTNIIRIRDFEFAGQKFKVKIPSVSEAEIMEEKVSNPSEESIKIHYDGLTKTLLENKKDFVKQEGIEYLDDDILMGGNSLKQLAISKCQNEIRIVETFKLLIPKDGEDMSNITYEEINNEIPFPIQLDLVKTIASIISPNYETTKKN